VTEHNKKKYLRVVKKYVFEIWEQRCSFVCFNHCKTTPKEVETTLFWRCFTVINANKRASLLSNSIHIFDRPKVEMTIKKIISDTLFPDSGDGLRAKKIDV
jgi:hypothetical protein